MTAPNPNFLSKKFVKILPQGFCPGRNQSVNITLTENRNPLQMQGYQILSTVGTP